MAQQTHRNIYQIEPAANVCNQVLREVLTLDRLSLAHVSMNVGNTSLWHQHAKMTEVYVVLKGEGILYAGNTAQRVRKASHHVLPPGTPHKLQNTGISELEHLVIAIPPFDPKDVEVLTQDTSTRSIPTPFTFPSPPITALDGATLYELTPDEDEAKLKLSVAMGYLPRKRIAAAHHHNQSDEIYFILSGNGSVYVGNRRYTIKKGSLVYVPKTVVHALESSVTKDLNLMCISTPGYRDEDFIQD